MQVVIYSYTIIIYILAQLFRKCECILPDVCFALNMMATFNVLVLSMYLYVND